MQRDTLVFQDGPVQTDLLDNLANEGSTDFRDRRVIVDLLEVVELPDPTDRLVSLDRLDQLEDRAVLESLER